jgi:hypothetical protein
MKLPHFDITTLRIINVGRRADKDEVEPRD